jgi:hypothetical protein
VTLRYPYEVRNEEGYFDDIGDEKVTKEMLDRAPEESQLGIRIFCRHDRPPIH